MTIQIWGKPACPYCDSAKRLLDSRQIKYEYLQLGVDFEREQIMEEFPEARTFPQIVVNGQKIGGYDKLAQHLEDTNYNGTGYTIS
jgi:glutaredoxin 3